MPSIKDLKNRIGTVKNTQQITKAMKMVSAAKLRRAQDAIFSNRPYAKGLGRMIKLATNASGASLTSPLLTKEGDTDPKNRRVLLVVVTSDRGLCGPFNSSVIKRVEKWLADYEPEYKSVQLAFIGKKAYEYFNRRRPDSIIHYQEFGNKAEFTRAVDAVEKITDLYTSDKVDEVYFVFNEFKNAIAQRVFIERFLPVQGDDFDWNESDEDDQDSSAQASVANESTAADTYLVKPDADALLDSLLKKHFATQAFRYFLESQAGEHGARMSAMDSASRNAREMIDKLTLQYNKQRQAGITKELLEIIAGSESAKEI